MIPRSGRNISISYELVVPADTRLRSRTGSGNQNAVGLRGSVDLQTGSGNVVFSNIEKIPCALNQVRGTSRRTT
jgi:hypothetical protein